MGPGLCLVELKAGSPDDYLLAILNKEMEHLFEREGFWLILMDGQENDPERGLHLGVFIKLVEDALRHLIPFQFDHHPHPVPIRFVPDIGNPLDCFLLNQFSDSFNELGFIGLIGKLVDNDIFTFSFSIPLNDRPGSKLDDALSVFISLTASLFTINDPSCREVRSRKMTP